MVHLGHVTVHSELQPWEDEFIKHVMSAKMGNVCSISYGDLRIHVIPFDKQVLIRFVNVSLDVLNSKHSEMNVLQIKS